eukprot:3471738-Pyramimonas_sp.AAC.4
MVDPRADWSPFGPDPRSAAWAQQSRMPFRPIPHWWSNDGSDGPQVGRTVELPRRGGRLNPLVSASMPLPSIPSMTGGPDPAESGAEGAVTLPRVADAEPAGGWSRLML